MSASEIGSLPKNRVDRRPLQSSIKASPELASPAPPPARPKAFAGQTAAQ
jgi:hypothetical protein